MNLRPDPTFHATPKLAMKAPAETLAFTLLLSPDGSQPDGLAVVDVDPKSKTYGEIVHSLFMPNKGDEFHHFGWNACSSSLSPLTGHAFLERRYLIIPGIRSSRIYVIDVKDPLDAKIHKIIEPEELFEKTGYSRPHTIHCGPEGIYVSTLGGGGEDGTDGPPGIFLMDCETFEILGRYEMDRGKQDKHYDFWWNLPRDYMVSSEWGLPPQFENGIVPEDLLGNKYGHSIHFWNLRERKNVQTIDFGENYQMALEIRPAHDPSKDYGFCGVVVDTSNLQGAIFTWWQKDDGTFEAKKTITIDPRPEKPENLPPGGIARNTDHPNGKPFAFGPQMVEISRDGKRVYWTNSLYSTWDDQFYPGDEGGQMVMADVGADGGLTLNKDFYVDAPKGYRAHQIRLEGGDCSTDSFCYPSV